MDTDVLTAKYTNHTKVSPLSAPGRGRGEVRKVFPGGHPQGSKIHVAAALFQLITDLLDELVVIPDRLFGDEIKNLFAA